MPVSNPQDKHSHALRRFIFLLLVLAISALTIAGSLASFASYEGLLREQGFASSLDALTQIGYLNHIIEDTANSLVRQLLVDNNIIYLMTAQAPDLIQELSYTSRLCSYAAAAPFVHSVYVYNAFNERLYTTLNKRIYEVQGFFDQDMLALMREHVGKRGGIIQRIVPSETRVEPDIPGYTYLYYYGYSDGTAARLPSAICINVDSSWVTDVMSDMDAATQSDLMIVGRTGQIIARTDRRGGLDASACAATAEKVIGLREERGYYVDDSLPVKSLVSYLYDDNTGCRLVRVLPYSVISEPVNAMRNMTLRIGLMMLLAGVLLAGVLSRRLYRPFSHMIEANRQLNTERDLLARRERESLLRNCLTMPGAGEENLAHFCLQNALPWADWKERLLLLMVGRDGEPLDAEKAVNALDRVLLGFGRLWASAPVGETLPVLLTAASIDFDSLKTRLQAGAGDIEGMAGASICIGTSAVQCAGGHLSTLYGQADELLHYRVFDRDCFLLTADIMKSHCVNFDNSVFRDQEAQLDLMLSAGETTQAKALLVDMLMFSSMCTYDHFINSTIRIAIAVYNVLNDLERTVNGAVTSHVDSFIREVAHNPQSVDAIVNAFVGRFGEIEQLFKRRKQTVRSDHMQETIKSVMQYIKENYGDVSLSHASIADSLNRSAAHLGRQFKSTFNLSISSCITAVRIENAKRLLLTTDNPIGEIAIAVGFANVNYFYTCFKHEVGITPSSYRAGATLRDTMRGGALGDR